MITRLRNAAASLGVVTRFARTTRITAGFSARGMLSYARAARAIGRGPHVPMSLQAKNNPDKLALAALGAAGERRLSYGQLLRESYQVGHALGAAGVRAGDRVALMMPNCIEYMIAQSTLLGTGGAAVQIGYRLKAQEIAHILDNATPRAAIVHYDYQEQMNQARALVPGIEDSQVIVVQSRGRPIEVGIRYEDAIAAHDGAAPPAWKDTTESATIVYTSGTTGKPKGARRSMHKTGLLSGLDFMAQVGMSHDDVQLVVCPLYHSAAPVFAGMMFILGASNVLLDRFDAEAVLQVIDRERITCAFMVPTMLRRMAELPESVRARYDTSSLRWITSGAAALSTDTAVRFQEAFGDILYNFYGSTETGLVTLAGPRDHAAYPGTIGRALFGNEIVLQDEGGTPVPAGEVGELYVRNKMLVTGYHRNREATEKAQRDGFFSVGDLGRVDDDGYYYLASRKHDMVISGGVNIYPREIENFLHDHPDIVEVAIIGVPDPEWGESLEAFAVVRPGSDLDEAAIIRLCRDGLASYKRPKRVHFLHELPRNPTGKILKRALREMRAQLTTDKAT